MKNYNFIIRLKVSTFSSKERVFRKLVKKVSARLKGKELFPEQMRMARKIVSGIKDWSFLNA